MCGLLLSASAAGAQTPEHLGLSTERLKRVEAMLDADIAAGMMPGAAWLVARQGEIAWCAVQGRLRPDAPQPMRPDAIFRIYSMTKPIVAVAVLQLVEEGRLQITDPVARYLPEIGRMKVGLNPPLRPMTVQDLLRHTSGLTYAWNGTTEINAAYRDARIGERGASNAEMVERLSHIGLRFEPGERFHYGVSTDVLGRLLEVLDGATLGEVLERRIFRRVGMVDTGFRVAADKLARAAEPSGRPGVRAVPRFKVDEDTRFESGGGGLLSTLEDYRRFAQALAAGGAPLLGRKTLAFMTADHLGARPGEEAGQGFGLGVEVRMSVGEAGLPGEAGEFGWPGAAGTSFWIDPARAMFAILMLQTNEIDTDPMRLAFRAMVQAAIVE